MLAQLSKPTKKQSFIVAAVLALVGVVYIVATHAASLVTTIEAESMNITSGAYVSKVTVANASANGFSGTGYVKFLSKGTITTADPIPLSTAVTSISLHAKADVCQSSDGSKYPVANITVDGVKVASITVSNTSWASTASATVSIPAGSHTLSVVYSNDYYSPHVCDRNLYVDNISLYGADATTTPSTSSLAAPVLTVGSDQKSITFTKVADVTSYVAAIKQGTATPVYQTLVEGSGLSYNSSSNTYTWVPTAVPGATVNYGLRTNVSGSTWAREVSITWDGTASTPPPSTPTGPEPNPFSNLPSYTDRMIFGTNNFVGWGAYASAKASLGINGDRACQNEVNLDSVLPNMAGQGEYLTVCENSYNSMKSTASGCSTIGATPTPLSACDTFVKGVASDAAKYGPGGTFWQGKGYGSYAIESFEIMNEPYGWWYRNADNDPASYARIADAAIRAGKAANPSAKFYLPLAPVDSIKVNGNWVNWNQKVLDADPNLYNLVDGFSIHIYDTPTNFAKTLDRVTGFAWGKPGGLHKPFIITEANLTDQTASPEQDYIDAMPQFVQIVRARPWVRQLFIFNWHGYSGRDYLGFIATDGTVRTNRMNAYKNAIPSP